LVVDLDGTLIAGDTLDECFAAALFRRPLATLLALLRGLFQGRAALKAALARLAGLDAELLPYRADVVGFLHDEKRAGRGVHLATAADRQVADAVAIHLGVFGRVFASDSGHTLNGGSMAEALVAAFPGGFSCLGDAAADMAVWTKARSAVVVGDEALAWRAAGVTRLERHFEARGGGLGAWRRAARLHQWSKNGVLFAGLAAGWSQVTLAGLLAASAAMALFCLLSSLTYVLNDIADLAADRVHPTKRRRPFAAGALSVRAGLAAAALGIPLTLACAFAVSTDVGVTLAAYCALTLGYSFGLKRIPVLDCMVIGGLFTLRLVAGVVAARLAWSPWFLAFGFSFFCSLALAKRHAELVSGGAGAAPGRGYRYEDRSLTLALGVAASTTSIIIAVLYLMDEVFPHDAYRQPQWLWAMPVLIFFWVGRVWLIAGRRGGAAGGVGRRAAGRRGAAVLRRAGRPGAGRDGCRLCPRDADHQLHQRRRMEPRRRAGAGDPEQRRAGGGGLGGRRPGASVELRLRRRQGGAGRAGAGHRSPAGAAQVRRAGGAGQAGLRRHPDDRPPGERRAAVGQPGRPGQSGARGGRWRAADPLRPILVALGDAGDPAGSGADLPHPPALTRPVLARLGLDPADYDAVSSSGVLAALAASWVCTSSQTRSAKMLASPVKKALSRSTPWATFLHLASHVGSLTSLAMAATYSSRVLVDSSSGNPIRSK
jgi:4-hydroxybenzoate polyprenyltransferase